MSKSDCIYCSGEYEDECKPPCSAPSFEMFEGVELCVECDHYRECHTGTITVARGRIEAALRKCWDQAWREACSTSAETTRSAFIAATLAELEQP